MDHLTVPGVALEAGVPRLFNRFFGFLGLFAWLAVGPGSLREAPRGPGKAHGGPWGSSRGPPDLPEPGVKNTKNQYFLQGPIERPVYPEMPVSPGHGHTSASYTGPPGIC